MHRNEILEKLRNYKTRFMEEAAFVDQALRYISSNPDSFDRNLLPGHITGSAWVVNPARTHVLLLHHVKLNQWFQPGGHADKDPDILRVALRETMEESGLNMDDIVLLHDGIFDVDVHTIPATDDVPRHHHYDIRFLVEIDDDLIVLGNNESFEIVWVPLDYAMRYNNNRSTYRMVTKTRDLFHSARSAVVSY